MGRLKSMLTILGLGAGAMYFMDPERGARRRSLVRDKAVSLLNSLDDGLEKASEDLRNRARGTMAEAMGRLSKDDAPDWLLEERARAELGRYVGHASAIEVRANQGMLTVSGPILAHEVDPLMSRLRSLRGVRSVENRLEVHESADNVPALQGQPRTRRPRPELMQENWSPGARLLTGVGGGALTLYGMGRGGLTGTALSLAGLGLALRGITNKPMERIVGLGSGRGAVNVTKTINVNAPVEEVYQMWSNFENFPRFMEHVKEVRNLGDNRSHWKVAGPAGVPVEWDAVTTRQVPNEVIGWRSVEGAAVKSAGLVQFRPNPGGGTRVTVRMSYNPVAGALGHAVASLLGADPKHAMDEDLLRFKSLIETGKTSAEGREVHRQEVTGRQASTR